MDFSEITRLLCAIEKYVLPLEAVTLLEVRVEIDGLRGRVAEIWINGGFVSFWT